MTLRKDQLEVQLKDEHQLIQDGVLRDDSPLDTSAEFWKLCDACRRGDLKGCQEMIATGVNINARDQFDYTPLILVCPLSFGSRECQYVPRIESNHDVGKSLRSLRSCPTSPRSRSPVRTRYIPGREMSLQCVEQSNPKPPTAI
jgi:hypothetical protein